MHVTLVGGASGASWLVAARQLRASVAHLSLFATTFYKLRWEIHADAILMIRMGHSISLFLFLLQGREESVPSASLRRVALSSAPTSDVQTAQHQWLSS
jgi:hypothetical protein